MTVAASALAGTPVAVSASRVRAAASTCAWAGVCFWLVAMPFEATRPLLRLPGQTVSSAEAALFLVFAAWGAALFTELASGGWQAVAPFLNTPLSLPWMVFLIATLVSALAAGAERVNAVHMAARFGLAFAAFLVAVSAVTSLKRFERVSMAALLSGAIASTLAILEFIGIPAVLRFLRIFRPGVFVVGAQARAAGPFLYPTIASMYLEILFALGAAFLLMLLDQRRFRLAAFAGVSLVLISEAIVLTFTRSGLITMAATLAVVYGWRMRGDRAPAFAKDSAFAKASADKSADKEAPIRKRDPGLWAIAALAVVLGIELWSSHSADAVRLRMTTEEEDGWYQATFDAPQALALTTGATTTATVTVTNSGLATWDSTASQPIRLAYHWLLPDEDRSIDFEGLRTDFSARVEPGERVTVQARVRAPRQPGRYRLMWDVVEEGRLWFSSERDAELFVTGADVTGAPTGTIGAPRVVWLPKGPARPGRLKLWAAAGRMWLDHPLLGVGPDNFRLLYGEYAHIPNADPRVHSNDMYVEILVDGGLVGLVAFAWLAMRALAELVTLARRAGAGELGMIAAGLTAAFLAIAVHGIVDSFFSFTATYVLFAVTLGLIVAAVRVVSVHAHRV